METKKGFSELILILIVVVVLAVVAFAAMTYTKNVGTEVADQESVLLFSPAPVSDSTDTTVLEQELDATMTGSVDSDVDSMVEEASTL